MKPITYRSEQLEDYGLALNKCTTLIQLQSVLEEYHSIAQDALDAIPRNGGEFHDFMAGMKKERKGVFAGEKWAERYSAVLMPIVMFRIGLVAQKFLVPFGCAFLRMREVGQIQFLDNGVAVMKDSK